MDFSFLISSERSGSNLITRLMDGHSRVCGPSPTHLFRILLDQRYRYGDLADPSNWELVLEDAVALCDSKLGYWATAVTVPELREAVPAGSLADLLRYVYEKEAAAWGKSMLFVKENHVYRHFPFLDEHFPGAKFVYLVRDPRDVALSFKLSPNRRGGVIRAAETWQLDQNASLSLYGTLAAHGRVVGLRYEDLVTQPAEELARVCSLLGLEFEPGMLRLDARPSNRENAGASPEWGNLDKPVIAANTGKYAGGLSREEIQFVEGTCLNEMRYFGYAPDHDERPSLVALRQAIQPMERYVKEEHGDQPEESRQRHARRVAVLREMVARETGARWG